MSDRRSYYRKRAKITYNKYKEKREEIVIRFGSKCYVCESTNNLQFHHIEYGELGKLGHASMWRRIKHLEEIENYPERFRLLCGSCHSIVTIISSTRFLETFLELIPKPLIIN